MEITVAAIMILGLIGGFYWAYRRGAELEEIKADLEASQAENEARKLFAKRIEEINEEPIVVTGDPSVVLRLLRPTEDSEVT